MSVALREWPIRGLSPCMHGIPGWQDVLPSYYRCLRIAVRRYVLSFCGIGVTLFVVPGLIIVVVLVIVADRGVSLWWA